MTDNKKFEEEITVLFHASLLGRTDILTKVISNIRSMSQDEDEIKNILSSTRPDDGATVLHIASSCGHSDIVRALLQTDIDLSKRATSGDYNDKRAYEVASDSVIKTFNISFFEQVALGNVKNIVRLLSAGIPLTLRDGSLKDDSPLHWACSFNNIEVVKILLSNGFDINNSNVDGITPLHAACFENNEELIELLLNEDADRNIMDIKGRLPQELLKNENLLKLFEIERIPNKKYRNEYLNKVIEINELNELLVDPSSKHEHEQEHEQNHENNNEVCEVNVVAQTKEFHDIFNLETEINDSEEQKLFVFWPPVQRQERLSNETLMLTTTNSLLICVLDTEIDIFPLLTWSGLMNTFDKYGFQPQIKRTAAGAKIHLSINTYACPKKHSYTIKITTNNILITASDITGLIYAIQSFVQLIHLHCEIRTEHSVNSILIPTIFIQDWPDVQNRAVMWTYRDNARILIQNFKDKVELLSRLRINILYLVLHAANNDNEAMSLNELSEEVAMNEEIKTVSYYVYL